MKEYFGENVVYYKQTKGKKFVLFPAIERFLLGGDRLLDVGCGNADLGLIAEKNGFEYYGLDASKDMLSEAKKSYPKGKFLESSSINFSSKYKLKFDVIIISMLFPAFSNFLDIVKTLKECKKVLKNNGKIIIGVAHPAYDQYMQFGLLDRKNVDAKFEGYFKSGKKFLINKEFDGNNLILEDYHWTISDYFNAIKKANLNLTYIDECPVNSSLMSDKMFVKNRDKFPTYLVLVAKK